MYYIRSLLNLPSHISHRLGVLVRLLSSLRFEKEIILFVTSTALNANVEPFNISLSAENIYVLLICVTT